jgi:hypothetical protein
MNYSICRSAGEEHKALAIGLSAAVTSLTGLFSVL